MKLYYNDILLGEVLTNHSISIEDMVNILDLNLDEWAQAQGWNDYDYEALRIEC